MGIYYLLICIFDCISRRKKKTHHTAHKNKVTSNPILNESDLAELL